MNYNTFKVRDVFLYPEKESYDELEKPMTLRDPDKFILDRLTWLKSQEGFVKFTLPQNSCDSGICYAEYETEAQADNARMATSMVFLKLPTSEFKTLYNHTRWGSSENILPSLKREVSEWLDEQPNALYAWVNAGGAGAKEDMYPIRDIKDISGSWLRNWPLVYLGFHTEEEALLFKLTWL